MWLEHCWLWKCECCPLWETQDKQQGNSEGELRINEGGSCDKMPWGSNVRK